MFGSFFAGEHLASLREKLDDHLSLVIKSAQVRKNNDRLALHTYMMASPPDKTADRSSIFRSRQGREASVDVVYRTRA